MGSFDLFGVNVVLPVIADQFGIAPSLSQWIVIAYILPITALSLPAGRWLDASGRRSAIVFLVGGFSIASLLVAVAPSIGLLLAARVVQGIFGAGVFASTIVLTFEAVRPEHRNRAIAITGAVSPLGAIAGPSLGALMTAAFGWPSVFLVNLVVGALAIAVFLRAMPRDARVRAPGADVLADAALIGTATAGVLLALSAAPDHGPLWLLCAVPSAPLGYLWWRRNRDSPVVRLVRVPGQLGALLALGAVSAAQISAQYLLAFFAQESAGLTVAEAGLALLPLAAGAAVAAPVGGYLADRTSAGRMVGIGLALAAVGVALFLLADPSWGVADIAWRAAVVGVGQGLANGPMVTIAMGFGTRQVLGSASAAQQFVRNFGFVAGPVIATLVWAASGYSEPGMKAALALGILAFLTGALLLLRSARLVRR